MPGLDLASYRAELLARFVNPALAHRTAQIAMDGSQKLPQRLLDTVRDRLAAGASITRLALGIAGWLHFLRGVDEHGRSYPIDDPQANDLRALHASADTLADPRERTARLLDYPPVFGDLSDCTALVDAVMPALDALRRLGVAGALGRDISPARAAGTSTPASAPDPH